MSKSKFVWTDEIINYLLANWGKESAHSMKLKFGCTWYSIVKKATELGLEEPKNNDWTAEDIIYLKELSNNDSGTNSKVFRTYYKSRSC